MCVELFFVPKLPRLERTNFKTEKKKDGTWDGVIIDEDNLQHILTPKA